MNNKYGILELYDHNAESYKKVFEAFDVGKRVVGIVHATGTGKSYNALQLAYDNKDKKIVYIVPSNGIIEHIKKIIASNPKIDLERDFGNLEFRTYQSLCNMSYEEIEKFNYDLMILDEFHHIGAPIWGSRVNSIINASPDMKIFGMTAYTVRDRGTLYERDMANPEKNELFSNNIVSRYDLCDAWIDGVLPLPVYKTAYVNLIGIERKLEEKVLSMNATEKERQEYLEILNSAKKRITEAAGISDLVRKNVKPNGKYLYFCPPSSVEGVNDIETIKRESLEWFKKYVPEEDIVFYTTTSEMGELGKKNRDSFYADKTIDGENADGKLRVMFAINQYNEGIHAPNIDGVIMGRGTSSDIVFYEQIGRALSVRGNTREKYDEYESYSIELLKKLCENRDIELYEGITKEEIIEKLLAPTIIDLTNNYDFMIELENKLKDRVREIQESGLGSRRKIKINDASFDIFVENKEIYEDLIKVKYALEVNELNWDDYYDLAKAYYDYYGNLEISGKFRTFNGYEYDDDGFRLGKWIERQRKNYNIGELKEKRIEKLKQIGMRFEVKSYEQMWEEKYELSKTYYLKYGNLEIRNDFKTLNGYEYDENGVKLGQWISAQRSHYNDKCLNKERIEKLKQIGMRFEVRDNEKLWEEKYELAKTYYQKHGNLEISGGFKTINGYEYDDDGINLGEWISGQRKRFAKGKIKSDRIEKLKQVGMRFEVKSYEQMWEEKYELAKAYYEKYGDSDIPKKFKTINGYEYDENGVSLGQWITNQRSKLLDGKLDDIQSEKLMKLGIRIEVRNNEKIWEEKYELAKAYYEKYGNLEIAYNFKTLNGYEYDENGSELGQWIILQRTNYNNGTLKENKKEKLDKIGMIYDAREKIWNENYDLAKAYYEHYGNLKIPSKFKTLNGYEYDENGIGLRGWVDKQREYFREQSLSEEKTKKLESIGVKFKIKNFEKRWEYMYELAKAYYEKHGDLEIPLKFKTVNGYEYDDNGEPLGAWLGTQKTAFKTNKLKDGRKEKLDKLGIEYEEKDPWYDSYELAKAYYEHYGNLEVPRRFRTANGYDEDENGFTLGSWLTKQRLDINRKTLDDEKKNKLLELGLRVEVIDFDKLWEDNYLLAKAYYEKHGNLRIGPDFKTINGYEYDENGVAIGTWIVRQRVDVRKEKMDDEKKDKLAKIGMIFDSKKNKEKIVQICLEYDIDMKANKKILDNISEQELISKIEYLISNEKDYLVGKKLHEIFSMSNANMKLKYNVTLEDLISNYYESSKGRNM